MQANVLFLRLRDADGPSPESQGQGRQQLVAAAEAAVAVWDEDARVVLEAPDGLAIVGRGDPQLAMKAAQQATAAGAQTLGIGLHHGSVEATQGGDGVRVQGEGLAGAAGAAAGAAPGAIAASPAFRKALAMARSRVQRRRLVGAGAIAGILALGGGVRLVRQGIEAARRPAVLVLDIRPAGEIYVDGELKGTAPPLTRLTLAPGEHSIEIRYGRSKPLKMDVNLQPGEELQLKHVFGSGAGGGGRGRRPGPVERMQERLRSLF